MTDLSLDSLESSLVFPPNVDIAELAEIRAKYNEALSGKSLEDIRKGMQQRSKLGGWFLRSRLVLPSQSGRLNMSIEEIIKEIDDLPV